MEQSVVVEQETNPELKSKTHFKGKVLKTSLAGALVDIGQAKPGILHVSRIVSTEKTHIHRVEDVLKEGQEVDVWVKKVTDERVELTMLEPLQYEWRDLKKDMVVKGKVVKFEKFGAFVEIGAERPALIHISEMAHGYVRKPDDIMKLGDEIEAQIIDVDRKKKQIKLSIKAMLPEPVAEEVVFEGFSKKDKTGKARKFNKKGQKGEERGFSEEAGLETSEPSEPEQTAMEIAYKQAMDKANGSDEDYRSKKVKNVSQVQEDILSRTLGNKVQTK